MQKLFFLLFCCVSVAVAQEVSPAQAAQALSDSARKYAYDCQSGQFQRYAAPAVTAATGANCARCLADATWALATNEYERGYMANALLAYRQAQQQYEALASPQEAALCVAGALTCATLMHRTPQRDTLMQQALAYAAQVPDSLVRATILVGMGNTSASQHDLAQAQTYLTQALGLVRGSMHPARQALYARALCGQATVQYANGEREAALKSTLEALRFARENHIGAVLSHINAQMAALFSDKGETDKAMNILNRAILADSADNHQANLARHYLQKGDILMQINQPEKAMIYYGSAVLIAKSLQIRTLQGEAYASLSKAHTITENYDSAKLYKKLQQQTLVE